MTEASLEQNLTAASRDHVVPGREIHLQDMRGYRYCEVGLITGTSQQNAIANVWNTTGVCDPTPEQLAALDEDAIASENQALHAWLNPGRQWTFDRLDVPEAGYDKTFGDITGTWMGAVSAQSFLPETTEVYDPGYLRRSTAFTFTFNKGSEIYILDAPDGEMFVMQSFTEQPDLTLGEGLPADLDRRLDLPEGWGFRTELLDDDLEISASKDELVHVLHDRLGNVYQGSDLGRAFSHLGPDDVRWYAAR